MRKSLVCACLASMLSCLAQATLATVSFENYAGTQIATSVISDGYRLTPASGELLLLANGASCGPACAANGTETLVMGGTNASPAATGPLTMLSTTGLNFYLLGLDYAEFSAGGPQYNATTIQIVGSLVGGGSMSQTLSVDGLTDGPGGNNDFQTAGLLAAWSTSLLSSVQFSGFSGANPSFAFQLDNIRVDSASATIPEPGSLALVCLALLGLASRRGARLV